MPHFVDDLTIQVGMRLYDGANFDTIVERVEYGGFGVVAFGRNSLRDGRMTAYKTLRHDLFKDPLTRAGFVHECLLWNCLWPHPNVTSAYAVVEMDDTVGARPFLALEYAEHGSLRRLLRTAQRATGERLPLEVGLYLAQQIAAGLAYLHRPDPAYLRMEPTVHRDFKPENVLIMGDGRAAITDFGLAKAVEESPDALAQLLSQHMLLSAGDQGRQAEEALVLEGDEILQTVGLHTENGIALGTIPYMSPEQWSDARYIGPPSDIFALGIMLSELLAGRHALLDLDQSQERATGRHARTWRYTHQHPHPRPLGEIAPDIPGNVETIYQRCLARDPEDRPKADEVLSALQSGASAAKLKVYEPTELAPHTPVNETAYWHTTALAYLAFQKFDDALTRVNRALNISSDAWDVLNTKGSILASMGSADEALQAYHTALNAMPGEAALGHKTVLTNLGELLSMEGKYREADTFFSQALKALPSSDVALQRALNYRYWALAEFDQGRVEEAARLADEGITTADLALQMDPTNPTAQKLLAALRLFVALRLGATDSAP